MGQHQPSLFNKGRCKALLLRSTDWEPTGRKEAEKAEEDLRFLVDIKLTVSLQSTFVANKVNRIWAAMEKQLPASQGRDPSPLLRDCETNLECWDKCFPPQYNRDRDILV